MAVTFLTNEDRDELQTQIDEIKENKDEAGASVITDLITNKTANLSFEKKKDEITAVITYSPTGNSGGSDSGDNTGGNSGTTDTLDTIAYENLTYRDIFITNNTSGINGFEDGLGTFSINTKGIETPEITDEVYDTPTHSLKCFGASQNIINNAFTLGQGPVYLACRIRVDRYVSGNIGWQYQRANYTNYVTDGFVTNSYLYTSTGATVNLILGTMNDADADCYIDDFVKIQLDIFDTIPTQEQMDALYENYISILKGEFVAPVAEVAETSEEETEAEPIVERYVLQTQKPFENTANECLSAFMNAVNEKAASLGMTSSNFADPAGEMGNTTSTARDLLRMTIEACGYKDLARVWGKNSKTITTKDTKKRQVTVNTTVQSADFENSYYIFGGKTGSLGSVNTLVIVGEVAGKMVAGVITGATSSSTRFTAMKELFDIVAKVIENPDYDTSTDTVTNATSAIACLVPNHVFNYEQYNFIPLFEQSADTMTGTASVAKVITCMTMLDYIADIHKTIDVVYTGTFNTGEVITYEDAMYAILLPSSNDTAKTVAYHVGKKILSV